MANLSDEGEIFNSDDSLPFTGKISALPKRAIDLTLHDDEMVVMAMTTTTIL
jgi:hypothetical protein